MGTSDGDRASAAALRLVDDVAGIYHHLHFILNETNHISMTDSYTTHIAYVQTQTSRDRCKHGLPKRLQLERRNGSGFAFTTREGKSWLVLDDFFLQPER